MSVVFREGDIYEVLVDNSEDYVVNLTANICDCGEWEILGLPCVHAIKCIDGIRVDVGAYVHYYMKKDAYIRTYTSHIHPIPAESRWPIILTNELEPHEVKRQIGRPRKVRVREASEVRRFK